MKQYFAELGIVITQAYDDDSKDESMKSKASKRRE